MDVLPTSLRPLPGGASGETFLAETLGEQVVVRIYRPRPAGRGPLAPEIDAAVLELVRGLLPVPTVLDVRRGDPEHDVPGLLVTERLPGERLDLVLPGLSAEDRARVGADLGVLVGRLGHLALPGPGLFTDRSLVPRELPAPLRDLPAWVAEHADRLADALGDPALLEDVVWLADQAQERLDEERRRTCLVHGDLNPKNVLVDPGTLTVTGLVDWEFAHAGSPYADLGNLLRFERDPVVTDAVVSAYQGFMLSTPDDLVDRARAADLFALVDLAARPGEDEVAGEVVVRARRLLAAMAAADDLHAVPAVEARLDAPTGDG